MEFALREAAERGDVATVEKLIGDGCDVDSATASTGLTALHKAALRNRVQVVTELVRAGADIHRENNAGTTALQFAEDAGFWEVADVLKAARDGKLYTVGSSMRGASTASSVAPPSSPAGAATPLRSPRVASSLRVPESYSKEHWYGMQVIVNSLQVTVSVKAILILHLHSRVWTISVMLTLPQRPLQLDKH